MCPKNDSKNPVNKCIKMLKDTYDAKVINLYNSIRDFIFQDIDYSRINSFIPIWITNGGISPESMCTKDAYEKLKRKATHPIFGRFVYYYDLGNIIAAVQDRLQSVSMFLNNFYKYIPCTTCYTSEQYNSISRKCGEIETNLHVYLNSIFIAYVSVFDLLAKLAKEQYSFSNYDFAKYKDMKSHSVIYQYKMKDIALSLTKKDMLFS